MVGSGCGLVVLSMVLMGRFEDALNPIPATTRAAIKENSAIECVGYLKDVRPWLAASQSLILTSYREGFPNALLQAGAMGVSVISSDVNGADEIIDSEVNGLIVSKRDTNALALAMDRVLDNPALLRGMASAARGIIEQRFNSFDVNSHTLALYRSLLGTIKSVISESQPNRTFR